MGIVAVPDSPQIITADPVFNKTATSLICYVINILQFQSGVMRVWDVRTFGCFQVILASCC